MLLSIRRGSKIYRMGSTEIRALDGIDLAISAGEFVSVMGPSGSGKSTLMNILGCLDRLTEGRYELEGQEVSELGERKLAAIRNRMVGFIFQTFNLLPRQSALQNVQLPLLYAGVGGRERNERSREALSRVGLSDRLDHHPSELSGGQRQRVAIARALVNRPSLILADEPTGNLDTRSGTEIMDMICELHREGKTIVLVTHEPPIAEYADRIIRMLDGKIESDEVFSGSKGGGAD